MSDTIQQLQEENAALRAKITSLEDKCGRLQALVERLGDDADRLLAARQKATGA